MVLSSEHTCFPHPAYGSNIILFPIEDYSLEDPTFDHIEVRIEGQDSTAIIFTAKDLEGVPNTSELTVASQLWLLFFSSIDFEDPKLSDTPFMELVLVKKDGTRITKRNNSYPYPGCVAPLLEFFREGN